MFSLIALAAAATALPPADRNAAFTAAGATRRGGKWVICKEDAQAAARIDFIGDVNADGRPEAVIVEDGSFCHGATGTGFALVSKQADGKWKLMTQMSGIASFLKTRGTGGWPDISVGGPGFCFPVLRWNGRDYANNRREYEGKPCR